MEDADQQPRVAVIIPAYNAAATIDRAIASIERQTYTNWEIVVANDASTDETVQLARQHQRVTVVSLPRNSGAAEARDLGVRTAGGEFITMLDADDESHSERLEIQLRALQMLEAQHQRPVLLYTGRVCVMPDGRRWVRGGAQAMSGRIWLTDLNAVLTGRHYLMGATLMMRREVWLELGGQALTGVDQELDIYARAANRGHVIAHIGLPLYYQHITPYSRQHFVRDRAMRFERILNLWDPANPDTIPDRVVDAETHRLMCHALYRLFTKLFITKGFFPQARELAQKAETYGPLPWELRCAVRMPRLYQFLNARKRRLAEGIYAWQSRGFLRMLDSGEPPLKALVVDPQLREALGVETASDVS
jgi:glycosyltransferase involved in cell wall biosynthesis